MSPTQATEQVVGLSRQKWQWMSQRDVASLDTLFHEDAVFVHMGATFSKEQELQVIGSGTIHYRDVEIHDTTARIIADTAIVLTTLDLTAVVGGNDVTNRFVVTEVYINGGTRPGVWTLASMSFTRLVTA